MQVFALFEKARMIRKPEQLVSPPISMMHELTLPRNALLHYIPSSKIDIGPASDYPVFRTINKPIQVYNALRLIDPVTDPRQIAFDANPIMRGYFVRNRRFRKLIDLSKMPKDEKTLIVANYSLIHHSYKYIRSMYSEYNEWLDSMYTVMTTVNEMAKVSQRNQFLILDAPDTLPAISRLKIASKDMDQMSLKVFKTSASRFLLELWKWLEAEDFKGIFDRIEPKHYRYVNLLIKDTDRWVAINLDRLHWWKKSVVDLYNDELRAGNIEKDDERKIGMSFNNLQLQKYILRLYMVLAAGRSVASIDADADVEKALAKPEETKSDKAPTNVVDEDDSDLDPALVDKDEEEYEQEEEIEVKKEEDFDDSFISSGNSKTDYQSSEDVLRDISKLGAKEDEDSSTLVLDEEVNALIDADLAELEVIATLDKEVELRQEDVEVKPLAVSDKRTYEQKNSERIEQLAEGGLLTAAEFRRLKNLSEKYKELPDPFTGKGKLVESVQVTPEEIELDTEQVIAPGALVLDDSMLKSTIETGQKKYIRKTLKKHILKSIMHVQNADIILDNIEVERTETVTGAVHNYVVKAIPIEGAPTTWRFPVPEIDEDGTFTANSVKYQMRQMRGDLPIRKVAYNKVALTSYYGKFFVYRGRKATNDYSKWMVDALIKESALGEKVKDIKTANVFVSDLKAPRSICSLSRHIKEFSVEVDRNETFVFHLDLMRNKEFFSGKDVDGWRKRGFTPIAKSTEGKTIYYEGESFYLVHEGQAKPLGELEELLGIDTASVPAEFVELKIGGKYVPIGLILAHEYGLSELIKRLKITVRRVPVGTRTQQQDHEHAIVFSDETLLYSKHDKLASLLLSGFLDFKKVVRNFSITDFDRRAVYQNVLDTTGGGTRVMRELRLAKDMFVDPITLEVLEKLGQPTDFLSILVYSTELLMDDMHKDELDMSEMRIKGYERIAGIIYGEMVKSIRAHNARPGKSRYPVDMKPFAVWTTLAKDSSVLVVKDINPIEDIKRSAEVTYAGHGGRSKETMVASTRSYRRADVGVISEATKESAEVGITAYMPAAPQLKNTLGMPIEESEKKITPSAVWSTSMMVAPYSDKDDKKCPTGQKWSDGILLN